MLNSLFWIIWCFLTSKYTIAFNIIASIMLIEISLKKLKPLYPKNESDRERDQKYAAFKREDLHHLCNRPVLYLFSPTLFLRVSTCWAAIAISSINLSILSFIVGSKEDKPHSKIVREIVKFWTQFAAGSVLYVGGISNVYEKRVEYDYSLYLGPDH